MKKGRQDTGSAPRIAGVIVGGIERDTVRRAVEAGAGALELRIDTFRRRDAGFLKGELERLKSYGFAKAIPIIVTVRRKDEGGRFSIPDRTRAGIFDSLMPYSDFLDIELRSSAALMDVIRRARRSKKR